MPRTSKTVDGNAIGIRIGRNIKIARTNLGITQSDLAERLGLENVTVSRIETGAQLPSIDRLQQIAAELKISLTSLIADTNKASGYTEMLAVVMSDLPSRDRDFVYRFVLSYAQHVKTARKK
jgi:transcriptional regulator with XRE-family HTH domain